MRPPSQAFQLRVIVTAIASASSTTSSGVPNRRHAVFSGLMVGSLFERAAATTEPVAMSSVLRRMRRHRQGPSQTECERKPQRSRGTVLERCLSPTTSACFHTALRASSDAAEAFVRADPVFRRAGAPVAQTPRSRPMTQLLNIFAPESTPAKAIVDVSAVVLSITAVIFIVVASLLVYAIVKFRPTPANADREPAQVYGSTQIELAWTIVPVLIVVVLFAATARVIHAIQDAPQPANAVEVTVVGHQFWWEYRYPGLDV